MRTLLIAVVTLAMVGCHAPKPDLNIFGASKVPSHGTGTYETQEERAADEYYNPDGPSQRNSGSSTSRDDGRLLAIDATQQQEDREAESGSREILSVRSPTRRNGLRGSESDTNRVRSATRPRDVDDGFRPVPVRITRSGVERASFNAEIVDDDDDDDNFPTSRVTTATEILLPSPDRSRQFFDDDDSDSSARSPRPIGSRGMRATELKSDSRSRTSVSEGGWSER